MREVGQSHQYKKVSCNFFGFAYIFIVLLMVAQVEILAQQDDCNRSMQLAKSSAISTSAYSLNDFYSFVSGDGIFDHNDNDKDAGFYFPANSKKALVWTTSLIWIGKQNGILKSGGAIYNYNSSLVPGKINSDGTADNPADPKYRVYRVRTDYKSADFKNEISQGEGSYSEIYSQYEKDWNEWPANNGAPFVDRNNNGIYEPEIDIPGVQGAHQTLWYVTNDLNVEKGFSNGARNFGIETQITIWGYKTDGALKNTIFRKYKLINKSDSEISEVYSGIYSDVVGSIGTRFYAGSDSLLGLGYGYNAMDVDYQYGSIPPAIGFSFLQGPLVSGNSNDIAIHDGKKVNGYKNLKTNSFLFYTCGGTENPTPSNSDNTQWYNALQGKYAATGKYIQIPSQYGSGTTRFIYNGDPVTSTGWIDGTTQTCGSRYILLGCGPFNIAPSDTQEIVFAELVGVGNSRLNSITELKNQTKEIHELYSSVLAENKLAVPTTSMIPNIPVAISNNSNSIILNWESDRATLDEIEKMEVEGYTFQGYNVYQLNSDILTKENSKLLAVFDKIDGIKNVNEFYYSADGTLLEKIAHFGNDNGINYAYQVFDDKFAQGSLAKGKTYHFAVSSYFVSNEVVNSGANQIYPRRSLESPLQIVSTQFRRDEAGVNYKDQLIINSNKLVPETYCKVFVENPAELKNHNYQVTFSMLGGELVWNLFDKTIQKQILSAQKIGEARTNYHDSYFPTVDGMSFRIIEPQIGILDDGLGIVEIAYAGIPLTVNEYDEKGLKFFGNHVWKDPNYSGLNNERDKYSLKNTSISISNQDIIYSYNDFEIRFTEEGSYAVCQDKKIIKVPFEIWDIGLNTIDDKNDDVRLIPTIRNNYPTNGKFWASIIDEETKLNSSLILRVLSPEDRTNPTVEYDQFRDICNTSGGVNSIYKLENDNGPVSKFFTKRSNFVINYLAFIDADNDNNPPPAGTIIRLHSKKQFTVDDYFEFNPAQYTNLAEGELPTEFHLHQNYPNPFNPETNISYQISAVSHVSLKVYDVLGREVATLVNEVKQPGIHNVKFTINNKHSSLSTQYSTLATGVYLYRLQAGDYVQTKKMVLLR